MIGDGWFSIAPPFVMLAMLAFASRLLQGTWLAPGSFFAAYWFFVTCTALLGAAEYPLYASGVYWIFFSSLAVCAGSLLGTGVGLSRLRPTLLDDPKVRKDISIPWLNSLIFSSFVLGAMAPLYMLFSEGYLNASLFSWKSILSIANRFSIMRYLEQYAPPLPSRILTLWIYIGALLAGIRYITAKSRKERFLSVLPVIPALLMTIITSAKAPMLFMIALFLSAAISIKVYIAEGRCNLVFLFKPILYFSLVMFPMIFIADILRGGRSDWIIGQVWAHLKPYFFGHLAAFSTWFETNWVNEIEPQWGAFSVAGLFDILALHTRLQGVFSDFINLELLHTNVYTIFRGLILDYTLLGSLSVLFAVGMLSGIAYTRVANGNRVSIATLSAFYVVTLFSFATNALNYNTILFALVFLFLYMVTVRIVRSISSPPGIGI